MLRKNNNWIKLSLVIIFVIIFTKIITNLITFLNTKDWGDTVILISIMGVMLYLKLIHDKIR